MKNFKELLPQIKSIIFDVDGVLSTSVITLHPTGDPMRTVNTKDGYSLQLAIKQGLLLGIITGGDSEAVRIRYEGLGFSPEDIYMKASYKMDAFQDFLRRHQLKEEEVMYMGDDIPDLEVMQLAGLAVCPADAVPEVKSISHYVSHQCGGHGCVRDVVEQVLKSQRRWMQGDAFGW